MLKEKWRRLLRCGTTCTSTRFFAKDTHLATFLLAQQTEELFRFQTVVEPIAWLLWKKSYSYLKLKKKALKLKKKTLWLTYSQSRDGINGAVCSDVVQHALRPVSLPKICTLLLFCWLSRKRRLLAFNCGWTNHVAALKEELQLSKVDEESVEVEEESTVAEVLTKAIRYMYTHLHFLTHRRTHRLHPSAYSTHNYSTTFPFRLNFIDVHHYMYSEKSSVPSRGSLSVLLPFVCIMPFARWCFPHNGDRFPSYL